VLYVKIMIIDINLRIYQEEVLSWDLEKQQNII
jgi:hypothetical protein